MYNPYLPQSREAWEAPIPTSSPASPQQGEAKGLLGLWKDLDTGDVLLLLILLFLFLDGEDDLEVLLTLGLMLIL